MRLSLRYYHLKAWETLRKHWKNALLMSVIVTLPSILLTLLAGLVPQYQPPAYPELYFLYLQLYFRQLPVFKWVLLALGYLAATVLMYVFHMGCTNYYVQLTRGVDLGWKGVFSWLRYPGKALWVNVRKGIQFFLWLLLLIFPGLIAALAYLLTECYLADEPELSAGEAIKRSKAAMRGRKIDYLLVCLSYVPVVLVSYLLSRYLGLPGRGLVWVLQVPVACWRYAVIAWFYRAVGEVGGLRRAYDNYIAYCQKAGASADKLTKLKQEAQQKLHKRKKR